MRIACIGGGPAGLYLGVLMRQRLPSVQIDIYERNQPADTFGFGVVFSDATLGRLAAADPLTHAAISSRFERWDDIEVHVGGALLRSTGHGFCGLERKVLLEILHKRARELGVGLHFGSEIDDLSSLAPADLIVICDGAGSRQREHFVEQFQPTVDVRPNRFVWLGSTKPLAAFTFYFVESPIGLLRVHAYPFTRGRSTFIVECTDETWRRGGFDKKPDDEVATMQAITELLEAELAGYPLISNHSIWRQFPTVRCARWSAETAHGPMVLLGDAAHTAHFSIGSGTKLAMEDAIALADSLVDAQPDTGSMIDRLARYEAARRPSVTSLQDAAEVSLRWFEETELYRDLSPQQFTYNLMTRSLRVSHASMQKRDPDLSAAVERLFDSSNQGLRPSQTPLQIGWLTLPHRIGIAGLPIDGSGLALPSSTGASVPVATLERFRSDGAGADALVVLVDNHEQTAQTVTAARQAWPSPRPLIVGLPSTRTVEAAIAARAAGADVGWIHAAADPHLSLDAARILLAERVRLTTGLLVAVSLDQTTPDDADAIIAAGRADLILLARDPAALGFEFVSGDVS